MSNMAAPVQKSRWVKLLVWQWEKTLPTFYKKRFCVKEAGVFKAGWRNLEMLLASFLFEICRDAFLCGQTKSEAFDTVINFLLLILYQLRINDQP